MFTGIQLRSAATTASHIQRDAPHKVGIVAVADGGSAAHALVRAADGEIVAWDGWYTNAAPKERTDLAVLEWDEWDDMPSKLLVRANGPWLADYLAFWLMPSYSPSQFGADILVQQLHGRTPPEVAARWRSAIVSAYIPVVDHASFERDARAWSRSGADADLSSALEKLS
ncbi:hypothetical protein JN535_08600 [Cellulosimicrobium cellulans]|uniref:hypothetical protein n=1 Tax=Cellulosimicrobium cellulans TaxID=1710 RepID=UPI0019627656|nr:hypothetical protein [Cellulosimicrobium cellulans]MBN0040225.1 hypothetical protein [Cellulosimicrobium cellulans]